MHVSFDTLSDNARLWVYQSSRPLSTAEQEKVLTASSTFINQWAAHGNNLQASLQIRHDQFLLLAVDEEVHNATGCSIDASVAFIKSIGEQFGIELFDRTQIAYITNEKIKIESINNFKNKVKTGAISEDAHVFNNAISTKKELEHGWLVPIAESWAGKFIPSATT